MITKKKQPGDFNREYKRVLILTLYSGENELCDSRRLLNIQTYKYWKQIVLSNLPNREAHDKLYSYIMRYYKDYDLFIKLDADMALIDSNSLKKIVDFFEDNPNVDQANFSVSDVLSGLDIMGLLVFTNKVSWIKSEEMLFVDHAPIIRGRRLLVWDEPAPIAFHCPDPHLFQAFHYGAHRALKAIQRDRPNKRWVQSALQWHLLMSVWNYYKRSKDRTRGFLILGALSVWRKDVDTTANEYRDESLKRKYEEYISLNDWEIYLLLKRCWGRVVFFNHFLYVLMWPKLIEYKTRSRIKTWFLRRKNSW